MKAWSAVNNSFCVFGDFAAKNFVCISVRVVDSVKRTCADAAAAALTNFLIYESFSRIIRDCVRTTFFCTAPAVFAKLLVYNRLSLIVLVHFSGAAAAAHADILERTAESGCFMPFKVIERNNDVSVHYSTPDVSFFAVYTALNRHNYIVCAAESVRNQNVAAGRNFAETVFLCTAYMFKRVLS